MLGKWKRLSEPVSLLIHSLLQTVQIQIFRPNTEIISCLFQTVRNPYPLRPQAIISADRQLESIGMQLIQETRYVS